ncbi:unnamed protein product, partial [marine sediment metagenome]
SVYGRNFSVDTIVPDINITYPITQLKGFTAEWISRQSHTNATRHLECMENDEPFATNCTVNNSIRFEFYGEDNNPSNCTLYLDYNISLNDVNGSSSNHTIQTVAWALNATHVNFTAVNDTTAFGENSTGYSYAMFCYDKAGNTDYETGTFKVDTVLPVNFIFNVTHWITDSGIPISNNSYSTDYTPQISWNASNDANFNRYSITFYNQTFQNASYIQKNISWASINTTNMSMLEGDHRYVINITAYDDAGNTRYTIDQTRYVYNTDSTGRALYTGWNIIGATGNNFTLHQLRNWT